MPQAPIFQDIFNIPWAELPPVMQKHYAVRPDSYDRVVATGTMNIRRSRWVRLLSPFLKLFGALVPYDGTDIPVTVTFHSGPGEQSFYFDRQFNFPGKPAFPFHSRLERVAGGDVVEFMRFGIGWRCTYRAAGQNIVLAHRGYVWRIGGLLIPLPLAWFLGRGAAGEEAVSDDTFKMWMTITHPLFGECYRYEGVFTITEALPVREVLILGGYGNFGKRIAAALVRQGVSVIIAGRHADKAEALAAELRVTRPRAAVRPIAMDAERDLAHQLAALKPVAVINTCGPFQDKDYSIAETCISEKVPYVDLADGRAFVTGITRLDDAAKAADICVISGASTVPALSSAVLEAYRHEFAEIDALIFGISPGQKAERGLATTKGILTYVGKPLKAAPGDSQKRYGWQDIYRQKYPELGNRWMANCDIPDLDLLPARYGIRNIRFSAGMENTFLHLGIFLLSWLVRLGLPLQLPRHAEFLLRASRWFDRFGTDAGGMHVIIRGKDPQGAAHERRWFIVAKDGDGPQIPCVPAILLAKRLAAGMPVTPGAYPCVGVISLEDYLQELSGFSVKTYDGAGPAASGGGERGL